MKSRLIPVLFIYLTSFVCANLLVKHLGAYGLWFSAFFLIPFDFVCRCLLQEKWKGIKLIIYLLSLTIASGLITYFINRDAKNIAIASVFGFSSAQLFGSIFYQAFKKKGYFIKVNGSDFISVIFDSIVFQFIAFGVLNTSVLTGQILIKFLGGLLWYFILFKYFKIQKKL